MASKSFVRWTLVLGVAAAATTAALAPAWAGNNGKVEDGEGKYANLTAQWWQWVFAQPAVDTGGTNTNPVLDTTGAYATAGQTSGIGPGNRFFFLAGTFGGAATRTVTVPAGKALFFPVFNFEADNAVDPPTNNTVPQLRAIVEDSIDELASMSATFDGQPVVVFRVKSPTFSYTLPAVDSLYQYFGLVGPQFEGTVKPAVSDGYWAFVAPPSSGAHTVQFTASSTSGFALSVTYFLTVP
jgi:hypothetical protein